MGTTELVLIDQFADLPWNDRVALFAYRLSLSHAPINTEPDGPFDVRHIFRNEWYIREMHLPAGMAFVGRPHRQGHLVKLLEGQVTVRTEYASVMHTAPDQLHTIPGFAMICYAHSNILAQTWHFNPDGCRDIDELENQFFGPMQPILQRGAQLAQERLK